MSVRILQGHVLDKLQELEDESVHCVVSSPPYWGLRSYGTEQQIWDGDKDCKHEWGAAQRTPWANGVAGPNGRNKNTVASHWKVKETGPFCLLCGAWCGELGLEPTYQLYVEHLVTIFDEVRRVLRSDGTVWLNLGDSYAGSWGNQGRKEERGSQRPINGPMLQRFNGYPATANNTGTIRSPGLKPKDLVGIPWKVAFALQDAGWWLRKDNIVNKRNPMPESVEDRTTTAHEYVFHLTKTERYWYDAEAIFEPFMTAPWENYPARARITGRGEQGFALARGNDQDKSGGFPVSREGRNRRSVWTVTTSPTEVAHFAIMPEEVAEICILAGCPVGGTVLDPFLGSGTTAIVADRLARDCIGIDLQPKYVTMAERRARQPGLALVMPEPSADPA